MEMPTPDQFTLSRKAEIVARLRAALPSDVVIDDPAETKAYECDALSAYRCPPLAVVLPHTTQEVSIALKICNENERSCGATRGRYIACRWRIADCR